MKNTERSTKRTTGGSAKSATAGSPTRKSDTGDNLSLAEVKDLIELISEKQFNEFELERGNFRLSLKKDSPRKPGDTIVSVAPASATEIRQGETVPTAQPVAAAAPAAEPPAEDEDLHIITSPIVGTFYRSPSPTADSFVKLGDMVEAGKTLCIIEAMKLMNEIQSDASGTVAKIFAENGQPVEYGQPLFGLKK